MNDSLEPTDQTLRLAQFAAELRFEHIPPEVIEKIKAHVLDGLGVGLHGSTLPWTRMVGDMVKSEGGNGAASLWGCGGRTSISQAVLVNATAGHAFEMDDIHKESVLHPNSLAVPIALGLTEARPEATGKYLLTAIVAGYEIGTRVGNAATTSLFLNGFHPQGTSGVFVAAATAGRILGLDTAAMQNALGIAGSMGAGLMAAQEGAMVKRLHAGRAAQSGVYAALLAKRGFTGISNVIEAEYGGFLSCFSRQSNPDRLLDRLGSHWEAGEVGYKMYPNVTSIHSALDAFAQLLTEHGLQARDIASIKVGCGHMTYVHTAWPYQPTGVTAAQMNLFYGLAVMALRGTVGASDYTLERIADPEVLAFMSRIEPYEDDEIERRGAAYRHSARVRVEMRDGACHACEVWERRGSPENPVGFAEIESKFRNNVEAILPAAAANQLTELVGALDRLGTLTGVNRLLSPDTWDTPNP